MSYPTWYNNTDNNTRNILWIKSKTKNSPSSINLKTERLTPMSLPHRLKITVITSLLISISRKGRCLALADSTRRISCRIFTVIILGKISRSRAGNVKHKVPERELFLPSYIHTLGTPNAYCNCSKSLILKGLRLGRGPLAAIKCLYSMSYACQAFNSKYFR